LLESVERESAAVEVAKLRVLHSVGSPGSGDGSVRPGVARWAFRLAHVPYGAAMFSSFVAALDIALVRVVFKGNVRLT
jgi:hypothetical protein